MLAHRPGFVGRRLLSVCSSNVQAYKLRSRQMLATQARTASASTLDTSRSAHIADMQQQNATLEQALNLEQPSLIEPVPAMTADLDAQNFNLDPSVEYWRTFSARFSPLFQSSSSSALPDNERPINLRASLQRLVQMIQDSGATSDTQAATYWAYHGARMSYFIVQALAGLTSHSVYEKLGAAQSDIADSFGIAGPGQTPLERLQKGGQRELLARATEAVGTWQQDYCNIAAGRYRLPWDMTEVRHPQYNPFEAVRRTFEFASVATETLRRRVRNEAEQLWMSSGLYPEYFNKSYHYQTDGWLSNKSAAVYEHSTEVLFLGRQDAMQRTALLPIRDFVDRQCSVPDGSGLRLLEVAAGTGRFHTYIKDNFPGMSTIASDLSPFYLQAARDNIKRWRSLRVPVGQKLGGTDNTGTQYLQASAEDLKDVADNSMDVVVNVYLFHELPDKARRNAAAEMFRVLRTGGIAVLTDSVQSGDRPEWDGSLNNFQAFNEPYYGSYIACDLGAMFKAAGFQCDSKYLCSATKTLSFIKP